MQNLMLLKYPIGEYRPPEIISENNIQNWIAELAILPEQIANITANLSESDLEIPYRPGGWTVRQVIHHLADSHVNAYTRIRLTLTEDNPTIRPYNEVKWANLHDANAGDIQLSISLLKAIHQRLVTLLSSLNFNDYSRTYYHPSVAQKFSLAYLIGNYAWHGKHHLAHINLTIK